jgi:PPOX class probable F420-dependent enzyme
MTLPDELAALLRSPALCYVATVMPGGSPQLTQTWVDTDGEHVVINIVQGMQKARNLARDPQVAVAVSAPTAPSSYYQIRGRVIEVTSEGGEASIEALSHKYTGGPYAWYGGRDQVRLIVKIEAEHISSVP